MQCLSRKKDEEFHQFFVLFLLVGTISIEFKTVLKSTSPYLARFFRRGVCVLAVDAAFFLVGTGVLDCPIKSKKAAEEGVFACGL